MAGHSNHTIFWETMGPDGGGDPSGAIADAIDSAFGSFKEFRDKFSGEADEPLRFRLGVARVEGRQPRGHHLREPGLALHGRLHADSSASMSGSTRTT